MARYSPEQLRNARILAAASRRPIIRKAIEEAGLVESSLRDLRTPVDHDSVGVLQQRPSQGWGPAGESVATDAAQFVRAAQKVLAGGFRGSAGELAQAVQRSRFPGRYAARGGEAEALLRSSGGGSSGGGGATVALPDAGGAQGADLSPGADVSGAVAALLSGARSTAPPISGPAAPAYSARAALPQGYVAPSSGGPAVAQGPDIGALLDAVRTQGGDSSGSGASDAGGGRIQAPGATSGVSAAGGSVQVAANANRAGVGLQPGIVKLVRAVSAHAGRPLTIGTGTNHNRLTVDGNVSDHYAGNAADLPTTPGHENVTLGRQALMALGVPAAQARRAGGGIYNIPYGKHRRIQVIFNTNAGGDHHNHVHVGVTAK